MILLDGRSTSRKIEQQLAKRIKGRLELAVVLVGGDPASVSYVNMKKRKCEELGIVCTVLRFGEDVTQDELVRAVRKLNDDRLINGILIQLPLPKQIRTRQVLDTVSAHKDVDGLNSYNLLNVFLDEERIIPCTPKGVIRLLEEYNIKVEGKRVCIVGFGDVVGKPLAALCLNRGATVTVCHVRTKDLKEHTLAADIIMTAAGKPSLIKADMVSKGVIVVDIGISRVGENVVGDVDFESVKDKCSYITPVPGGVGPMTIAMLIENLIRLSETHQT